MDNSISATKDNNFNENDKEYLRQAIEVASENILIGGGPFGAVIVTPEGVVFRGGNGVTNKNDPTAHAEVTVIRIACEALGTFDLSGCVLYSSCEPCPMCLGASLWSRVERVVFAADRYDAAAAGFDDAAFYEKLEQGGVAERMELPEHNLPFDLWDKNAARTEY